MLDHRNPEGSGNRSTAPLIHALGNHWNGLFDGRPQQIVKNPAGAFRLYRIGDAVASRNVHAAIYDALRLCKDV